MNKLVKRGLGLAVAATSAALLMGTAANAAVVDWTDWSNVVTSSTTGGSATGTGGVTYSGELESLVSGYPSYAPAATFSDGSFNGPTSANGIIQLFGGGGTGVDTITFAGAGALNPLLSIWSLGAGGSPASFIFDQAFTVISGGPSAEYGGGPLGASGETVTGSEANGTIQFLGDIKSISWTNPQFENWYGIAVGVPGSAVPEPGMWALMMIGVAGLGLALRSRRRQAAVAA
jgi:hypothetical protein